jgi:hypothetical protein
VEEYEVKKVLDSHRYGRGRKLQYLVAWKGYPDSDNQWVNWDDAEGAQEAIREFKCLNPDREAHIKASSISSHSTSPTRICSMSTSPSLTANWNFDTPENRAAWDVITRPSSYFTPAVTYGDNNNIDDAATYNDCRQGRRSPGIDSTSSKPRPLLEMWKSQKPTFQLASAFPIGTTAQADPPFWKTVANAWADDFLFRAYIQQEKKQALLASLPATLHYPNAAILFESGDDEDDNIKCGRCENPIAYCHCSPTMLPPHINVNEEEDNEETPVSPAKTSEQRKWPGGGTCRPRNGRRDK